jgi:hypothetical protein
MWFVAFAAGYVLGARTDKDEFADVVQAFKAVRDSDEVRELVVSLRSHAGHALRGLAELVERRESSPRATTTSVLGVEVVERVRRLIGES